MEGRRLNPHNCMFAKSPEPSQSGDSAGTNRNVKILTESNLNRDYFGLDQHVLLIPDWIWNKKFQIGFRLQTLTNCQIVTIHSSNQCTPLKNPKPVQSKSASVTTFLYSACKPWA